MATAVACLTSMIHEADGRFGDCNQAERQQIQRGHIRVQKEMSKEKNGVNVQHTTKMEENPQLRLADQPSSDADVAGSSPRRKLTTLFPVFSLPFIMFYIVDLSFFLPSLFFLHFHIKLDLPSG